MTSSECMTWLVDHDVCNSSIWHAWTAFVMVSVLWQAVSGFLSTLLEL